MCECLYMWKIIPLVCNLDVTSQSHFFNHMVAMCSFKAHTHCLQAKEEQCEPSHPEQLEGQMQRTVKLLFFQWLHAKKKKKSFWLITAAVCVNMNCKLLFEQAKSSLIIQTCCKTARWGGNLKQPRLNEVLARHLGFVAAAGGWKERCHFQSGCQDAACICRSRSCSPRL